MFVYMHNWACLHSSWYLIAMLFTLAGCRLTKCPVSFWHGCSSLLKCNFCVVVVKDWCFNWSFLILYSYANHTHLQGEQAKNIPGESMTEEHYMDRDGNLISRKVIRKVIRRVSTPTPENQGDDRWHRDLQHSPTLQEEWPEVGTKITFNTDPGFKV